MNAQPGRHLSLVMPQMPAPPDSDDPSPLAALIAKVREARENTARKIACPWCHAAPGQWCERWQGGAKPGKKLVTGFLHPSRCEAAGVDFVPEAPKGGDE